jgi:hypothetical protein
MKKIACGYEWKMPATIEDVSVLESIEKQILDYVTSHFKWLVILIN